MGVYVFRVKDTKCIKIGYTEHSNPWKRVAFRGFANVILPDEIKRTAHYRNLELMYWLHNLDMKCEKHFHKLFANYKIAGEWFDYEKIIGDDKFKKLIVEPSRLKGTEKAEAEKEVQHQLVVNKLKKVGNGETPIKDLIINEEYTIDNILNRIEASLWCGKFSKKSGVEDDNL